MTCPKCSARGLIRPNEDGDLECLCGLIIYTKAPMSKPEPVTGRRVQLDRKVRVINKLVSGGTSCLHS